jgi:hypothetical protein
MLFILLINLNYYEIINNKFNYFLGSYTLEPLMSSPLLESNSWKALWKLKLNARLILFLWKIAWNLFPSKAKLKAIFQIPSLDSLCPLCSTEEDSLSHLFFNCIFARVAWRSSFWSLDSLSWSSFSLSNWIKGIIHPHSSC